MTNDKCIILLRKLSDKLRKKAHVFYQEHAYGISDELNFVCDDIDKMLEKLRKKE